MYTNVMDKWSWGGMDNVEDGIYMDENNRRMVTNFRLQMSILAEALLEEGDPERALDICEELLVRMPNENVPISRVLMTVQGVLMELSATEKIPGRTYFDLPAERRARAQELAKQLTWDLFDIQADALNYYYSLDVERYKSVAQERRIAKQVAELMQTTATLYMPEDSLAGELTEELEALEAIIAEAEMRMANLGSFEFLMSIAPTRIAILASGSGSNAEAILRHFEGSDTVDVAFVGCNRPESQAGIYERTRQMGVETTRFNKAELLDGGLLQALQSKGIDWVVLAGFLMHIPESLVRAYCGRMLNVHPSLLPKFGGKGMYGMHVHARGAGCQ